MSQLEPSEWVEVLECPICFWPTEIGRQLDRHGFGFQRCASCLVLYINPRPTEAVLRRFYDGPYWESVNADRSRRYRLEKQFRRAVLFSEELQKGGVAKGGSVLEIGSGFGGVVWALGELMEMKTYAIELDPDACRFQESLGVEIFNPKSTRGNPNSAGFDVLVLSHVLEHQLNPRELLEQAFSLVSSTGTVLIEVPHGHFVIDGGIEHPLVFSRSSLDRLIREFCRDIRYRVHNGAENIILPPKYLLGVARMGADRSSFPARSIIPSNLSILTQSLATKMRNFGPLRGLNYRLGILLNRGLNEKVEELFLSLPYRIRVWLTQ